MNDFVNDIILFVCDIEYYLNNKKKHVGKLLLRKNKNIINIRSRNRCCASIYKLC